MPRILGGGLEGREEGLGARAGGDEGSQGQGVEAGEQLGLPLEGARDLPRVAGVTARGPAGESTLGGEAGQCGGPRYVLEEVSPRTGW